MGIFCSGKRTQADTNSAGITYNFRHKRWKTDVQVPAWRQVDMNQVYLHHYAPSRGIQAALAEHTAGYIALRRTPARGVEWCRLYTCLHCPLFTAGKM